MKFEILRDNCKHEHPGYNEDHQLIYSCRHKDRVPNGCSWGMCHEAVCPIMAAMQKEPMNRGDAIRQLDNKGLALLLAQMMDTAAIKTIKLAGLQDVEVVDFVGRMEKNIENFLEFLDSPAELGVDHVREEEET